MFLPGKSHGQKSLVGYSPWGRKRIGHDLATKQQYTKAQSLVEVDLLTMLHLSGSNQFVL